MLGVVLAGTAIITITSSSISFYGARRGAYEWLSAVHRNTITALHRQRFAHLEAEARLLASMPAVQEVLETRHVPELQVRLDSLLRSQEHHFWAVLNERGTVIAASDSSCSLEGRQATRSILKCGRIPAFAVTVPVKVDQGFQGQLVLAFQINDAFVDTYQLAAGTEVVLIDPEGPFASSIRNTSGQRIFPSLGAVAPEDLWAGTHHFGKYVVELPHYRGYYNGTQPLAVGVSSLPSYLYSVPLLLDHPQVPVRAVFIVPRETMDLGAFYSTVIMVAFSLLLLPLLGFIVWRLISGFNQPISLLGKMTARVAAGDLECAAPVMRQDELGQLTRDFNDMVRKLKETQRQLTHSEKMAAVGQLAAGVGHEINNPLAYVTANIDFAKETLSVLSNPQQGAPGTPLPAEVTQQLLDAAQALEEAQEGAQRVGRIVRDLRTFARSDNAEETQVLRLRPIIEAALKLASSALKHRARVTCDFRESFPVKANEARLVQVFINLLVNAAQALPEGRAEENAIHITTDMSEDGFVVAEVSDTGKGMPPEVLERIFEPFFTTKPVGQGTGLGLSISKNLIERLGGSLTAQSTLGKGTTFRITLPATREEFLEGQPAPPPPAPRERRGRILVVDDEPLVGSSAKRILKSVCDVVVATSSREALELVEAGQRFDLVLCDLMMPQMTGMELHAEFSIRVPELAARMWFLTGGAFTEDARQFLVERRWLEKPFDNESLRSCISQWLQQGAPPASGPPAHG